MFAQEDEGGSPDGDDDGPPTPTRRPHLKVVK